MDGSLAFYKEVASKVLRLFERRSNAVHVCSPWLNLLHDYAPQTAQLSIGRTSAVHTKQHAVHLRSVYVIEGLNKAKHIDRIFKGVVDWQLIKDHWKDLMQIARSPSRPASPGRRSARAST